MDDVKKKIVQFALERMHTIGIRSLSVDDITRSLGISKKTFYVYFATKDALVETLLDDSDMRMRDTLKKAVQEKSVVTLLVEAMQLAKRTEHMVQPQVMMYDLKKYYPTLLAKHKKQAKTFVVEVMHSFLQKGVEEHIFREDMDVEIVAHFFAELHSHMMDAMEQNALSKSQIVRISRQGIDILVRGIITEHGKQLFESQLRH